MNERVVVVDDEESVREVVTAYLEREGFIVHAAATGREGLELALTKAPDVLVLDLMLPDRSGEEICREIRGRSDVPIVMLTAKGSEDERVTGLEMGADDYLAKPFSPRELVARVKAVLRRSKGGEAPLVEVLSFDGGRLRIDTVTRAVTVDGREVELTPSEYGLLVALAQYPTRPYSRLELINKVRGYDFEGYERTIDAHVKNLRRKLEPDAARPRWIQTVHGVGYRLSARSS